MRSSAVAEKPMAVDRSRWLLIGALVLITLVPACGSSQLTARIVLPTRTLVAGTTVHGMVIVSNATGKVVIVKTCGSPFQVALANDHYEPGMGWPLCLQDVSIPVGESTWKVDVQARNLGCLGGNQQGQKGMPKCLPNGDPPPLPIGAYRATLYQDPHVVSDPDPIEVTVTR
jgi:hypothetical protein